MLKEPKRPHEATSQSLLPLPAPAVSVTRSLYGYVNGNPLNATDPSGLIDKSLLSSSQINQINQECSTWQNQSLCTQAAFCAEWAAGIGSNSGGDCRKIADIAANDYAVVQAALAKAGPCNDVELMGGYMATHAEAERDLAETKAKLSMPRSRASAGTTKTTSASREQRLRPRDSNPTRRRWKAKEGSAVNGRRAKPKVPASADSSPAEPDWVRDTAARERLLQTYIRLAKQGMPEDEWAAASISDAIWRTVEPEYMLGLLIEVVNRLADDPAALNYFGAGPLEELLGGDDVVMRQAVDEAKANPTFRTAVASVYPVRYNETGFEELHRLTTQEF